MANPLPFLALGVSALVLTVGSKASASQKGKSKTKVDFKGAVAEALKRGDYEKAYKLAAESGDKSLISKTKKALADANLHSAAGGLEAAAKERAKEKAKQKDKAKKAAKSKDWQAAVANALASQDAATVKQVAETLSKAGKSEEAKQLATAFKDLIETATKPSTSKPAKATKPAPVQNVTVKKTPKAPTPKAPPKAEPVKPKGIRPAPVKNVTVKKKPSAKEQQARDLIVALNKGKRYTDSEPRKAVGDYQEANKLLPADKLYGPGTAMSLWTLYKLLPPNPYYWSKDKAKANRQTVDYQRFLDGIATEKPSLAARVAVLKNTVGL